MMFVLVRVVNAYLNLSNESLPDFLVLLDEMQYLLSFRRQSLEGG